MATRPALRLLATAALLAGAAAVLVLALRLVSHVAGGPDAGLWLFAWSAGFGVLVPVLVTMAAVIAPVLPRRVARAVIPHAGWKIPGAGQ